MLGWKINFYQSKVKDLDVNLQNLRKDNMLILSWDVVDAGGIDFVNFTKIDNYRKINMSGYPILVIVKYKDIKDILSSSSSWYKDHKKIWSKDEPIFIDTQIIDSLLDEEDIIIEAWDQS